MSAGAWLWALACYSLLVTFMLFVSQVGAQQQADERRRGERR